MGVKELIKGGGDRGRRTYRQTNRQTDIHTGRHTE